MVPTAFETLESLPLTPNGKVDRRSLLGKNFVGSGQQASRALSPPQNLLELRLLQLWRQVLGIQNIGVHDGFFELGGHSLLAVKLIGEINKTFHVNVGLPVLFLNPTIEGIARVITQNGTAVSRPELIQFKPGRTEGTLFFLEPTLGLCCLADHMDTAMASFGVSVPVSSAVVRAATENRMADLPRLEEMARPYVQLIASQTTAGPCVLLGHSFGGALAFEAAHQLGLLGRNVDRIVLLDSFAKIPWLRRVKDLTFARLWWSVNWRIAYLRGVIAGNGMAKSMRSHDAPTSRVFRSVVEPAYQALSDVPWEPVRRRIFRGSVRSYRYLQFKGRGILVRALDQHLYDHYADMGWGSLFADGLEMIDAAGDHFSLLADQNISGLAQSLDQCLASVVPGLSRQGTARDRETCLQI